jgi:hypothetical protein
VEGGSPGIYIGTAPMESRPSPDARRHRPAQPAAGSATQQQQAQAQAQQMLHENLSPDVDPSRPASFIPGELDFIPGEVQDEVQDELHFIPGEVVVNK